jgi:hypothetical protein
MLQGIFKEYKQATISNIERDPPDSPYWAIGQKIVEPDISMPTISGKNELGYQVRRKAVFKNDESRETPSMLH